MLIRDPVENRMTRIQEYWGRWDAVLNTVVMVGFNEKGALGSRF